MEREVNRPEPPTPRVEFLRRDGRVVVACLLITPKISRTESGVRAANSGFSSRGRAAMTHWRLLARIWFLFLVIGYCAMITSNVRGLWRGLCKGSFKLPRT